MGGGRVNANFMIKGNVVFLPHARGPGLAGPAATGGLLWARWLHAVHEQRESELICSSTAPIMFVMGKTQKGHLVMVSMQ